MKQNKIAITNKIVANCALFSFRSDLKRNKCDRNCHKAQRSKVCVAASGKWHAAGWCGWCLCTILWVECKYLILPPTVAKQICNARVVLVGASDYFYCNFLRLATLISGLTKWTHSIVGNLSNGQADI